MKTEKSKDHRLVFITELVWKNWQVLLYAFDREGKTLSFPSFCAEAEKAVAWTVSFLVISPLPRIFTPYWHLDRIPFSSSA